MMLLVKSFGVVVASESSEQYETGASNSVATDELLLFPREELQDSRAVIASLNRSHNPGAGPILCPRSSA